MVPPPAAGGGPWRQSGVSEWRAAFRRVLRLWRGVAVGLVVGWVGTRLLIAALPVVPGSEVDRLYAEHDCHHTPDFEAGRTVLLVRTGDGRVLLVPDPAMSPDPVAAADGVEGLVDWLEDNRAELYGWCQP